MVKHFKVHMPQSKGSCEVVWYHSNRTFLQKIIEHRQENEIKKEKHGNVQSQTPPAIQKDTKMKGLDH